MIASVLVRAGALVAFTVLGIVWSSTGDGGVAAAWVVSFALLVAAALWYAIDPEDRPDPGAWWDALPGPSKNPDDYR